MLFNIQVLRGIAAISVVWIHAGMLIPPDLVPDTISQFGYGGVDLFFVISGFIMVCSTYGRTITPIEFVRKRIKRIVPLYYLVTIAVFINSAALPHYFNTTRPEIVNFAHSLSFIPFEKTEGRVYPIYYLGWTLNYEMAFYLIFAASLWMSHATRAAIIVLVIVIAFASGLHISDLNSYGVAAFFYTRPIILDFALGILVGYFWMTTRRESRTFSLLLVVAGAIWFVFGGYLISFGQGEVLPPTDTVLRFGVPSALIVAGAVGLERSGWKIGARLMHQCGDASYSIYLFHYFFVAAVIAVTSDLALGTSQRVLLAAAAIIGAVALGMAAYRLVERPLAGDWSAYGAVRKYWRAYGW